MQQHILEGITMSGECNFSYMSCHIMWDGLEYKLAVTKGGTTLDLTPETFLLI